MNPATRLTIAGFLATAIGFGPARVGLGLFMPQFADEFSLSLADGGHIASIAFAAFLIALPITAVLVFRLGPRTPVILACLMACTGSVVVATASSAAMLTAGIVIAGSSAGLCWTPFNNAARHCLTEDRRNTALSIIATGTATGVVIAGVLSLFAGMGASHWRQAWWTFASIAFFATIVAWFGTPKLEQKQSIKGFALSHFYGRKAWPLHTLALVFGATNAIFITFAAKRIADTGGLPGLVAGGASAVVFISYGILGFIGVATGRLVGRFDLGAVLRVTFAAAALSMVLIAWAPNDWIPVITASALHGAALMVVSAVLSFWSLRLFPNWSTTGFTTALMALAIGSLIGPTIASGVIARTGEQAVFALAAVPSSLVPLWPKRLPALPTIRSSPVGDCDYSKR
ncbi:MFS transporter [Qipengyuania sp. XHP0211]|uniref:MFS transporter n=1 Tax=Qipengyuania sp. XHP0211 TaxID=3038079 RepID=UPI00242006F4|nr:MFS transporter [Qipengyuania sp. XHP0211]MDG5750311.1 MFS transporter [Qipengyuania sp. XHP0211]